jgi:hypothetical protein
MFLWCGQYVPSEEKFYGALKFEGPADKATRYKYTFKVSKFWGTTRLKVARDVLAEPFESVFRSEDCCVVLDLQTIKRFSRGDKLSFCLRIDLTGG